MWRVSCSGRSLDCNVRNLKRLYPQCSFIVKQTNQEIAMSMCCAHGCESNRDFDCVMIVNKYSTESNGITECGSLEKTTGALQSPHELTFQLVII
jgi:hypothetical protein